MKPYFSSAMYLFTLVFSFNASANDGDALGGELVVRTNKNIVFPAQRFTGDITQEFGLKSGAVYPIDRQFYEAQRYGQDHVSGIQCMLSIDYVARFSEISNSGEFPETYLPPSTFTLKEYSISAIGTLGGKTRIVQVVFSINPDNSLRTIGGVEVTHLSKPQVKYSANQMICTGADLTVGSLKTAFGDTLEDLTLSPR